jgi:isopentenyldiphosphate isomerase
MDDEKQDAEFSKHLHEEKLRTLEARTTYTIQKLIFVTGLLGLGSLDVKVGSVDLSFLVYLAPWLAIAFDFYIMGEDYSVKRIGAFLGNKSPENIEKQWETWVAANRDPFAPLAIPILTTLILIGSTIITYQQHSASQEPLFILWMVVTFLTIWLSFFHFRWLRKRILKNVAQQTESPSPLAQIITTIEAEDHQLTDTSYHEILEYFVNCQSDPSYVLEIQQSAKEYGEKEFFLCTNQKGEPVSVRKDILEDFHITASKFPTYQLWFHEGQLPDKQPTLLIARWLCHLVGFRHRVVHLFISHPELGDHTLIQIRALDKAESPGCFDLPAAGHTTGTDTIEESLHKELMEELGVRVDALKDFAQLGSYNYSGPSTYHNVEFRTVFFGRLNSEDWLRINADSNEVAALVSLPIYKLEEMIVDFPERVASGLKASFPLFLKHRLRN